MGPLSKLVNYLYKWFSGSETIASVVTLVQPPRQPALVVASYMVTDDLQEQCRASGVSLVVLEAIDGGRGAGGATGRKLSN